MSRILCVGFARCGLVLTLVACGGGSEGSGGGGAVGTDGGGIADGGADAGAAATADEQVRLDCLAIINQDPRLAQKTPLAPADYGALAGKLAAVSRVETAEYAGDTLGTVLVKVRDSGTLYYRHIGNDYAEAATLPPQADYSQQKHPKWNGDWLDPRPGPPIRPPATAVLAAENTYATHFPFASAAPDPEFSADKAVVCPQEGRVALVDFAWTSAHLDAPGLYSNQYMVDGVPFYDRLRAMAEAAGFQFDFFKDLDINVGNFTKLADYSIVILNGHGGILTTRKVMGANVSVLMMTDEKYDARKLTASGISYEDAYKKGYLLYELSDSKRIAWTPYLFRDFYKPSVAQLVMLNQCHTMMPFFAGYEVPGSGPLGWNWFNTKRDEPIYSFGDALMAAGVHAVTGYVSPATPEAIVANTMPFFRRLFGGNFSRDKPPSPLNYWPTCMGAGTFFRLAGSPATKTHAGRITSADAGKSIFTMFALDEAETFRRACPTTGIPHAAMQDFMLRVGTPAPAFQACWDKYWSKGDPVGLKDPLCNQGDKKTTQELTTAAACGVKVARQATNAMLRSGP
jgi:hypothetical protein